MKKSKVIGKVPAFFVAMVTFIEKRMNTKIKLTCGVFSTKKIVPVLPMLNSVCFSIVKISITHKLLWRSKENQKFEQE